MTNSNFAEKVYIFDIIFNEFLGIEYTLEVGTQDYEITLQNDNEVVFEDSFLINTIEICRIKTRKYPKKK